jgi:hypothetical protein
VGIGVQGSKKLLRRQGPNRQHERLVAVVAAAEVSVAKNPRPGQLSELFAVAKNAEFGLAGKDFLAAKQRAFAAQDSEAVVAQEFGGKIRSGLGLHSTKIARPLGGLKPLP